MASGILAGTGYVDIIPVTAGFAAKVAAGVQPALTATSNSFTKAGASAARFGSTLTRKVSLPLVAVGGVAIKMALDFDTAFARISGLAGDTGLSLDVMKQKVLALAGTTGQAPIDLANALYFVASASDFAAKNAFPILTAAAKGAEIGMGSVDAVAKTLTATMNAYQGTGLSTANIMNILTAATKGSAAEMSDFATALGPVTGVAAAAGISFNDLTGGLAAVVNAGIPFDRAVTGFRFLVQSLSTPTAAAKAGLDSIGLSANDLYTMLSKPGGLTTALQTIYDKTQAIGGQKGRDIWAAITGGARGAIVATDLVGTHTDATNKIIEQTGKAALDSATTFQDAFGTIVKNDPAIQFKKTFAALQADLITLGNDLLPFVEKVLQAIDGWAKAFHNLSPSMQGVVAKFLLIAVAAGPLIAIFGGLLGVVGRLAGAFLGLGRSTGAAAGGLSRLGPVGALAAVGVGLVTASVVKSKIQQDALNKTVIESAHHLGVVGPKADLAASSYRNFGGVAKDVAGIDPGMLAKLPGYFDAITNAEAAMHTKMLQGFGLTDQAIVQFDGAMKHATGISDDEVVSLAKVFGKLSQVHGALTKSQAAYVAANLRAGNYAGALKIVQGALVGATAKQHAHTAAVAKGTGAATKAIGSILHLSGATKESGASAEHTTGQILALSREINVVPEGHKTKFESNAPLTTNQVLHLHGEVVKVPTKHDTRFTTNAPAVQMSINGVERAIAALHDKTVHIGIETTYTTTGHIPGTPFAKGGIVSFAQGGVVAAREGMIAKRPTLLVGEGIDPTFAGRGAEAIVPLNDKGIGILSEAIRRAMKKGGGGDDHEALAAAFADALSGVAVHMDGNRVGSVLAHRERLRS